MLLPTHLAGLCVGEVALLSWFDAIDNNGQVRKEIRLSADQTKGRYPAGLPSWDTPIRSLRGTPSSDEDVLHATVLEFGHYL
jgi:hypothetical protein